MDYIGSKAEGNGFHGEINMYNESGAMVYQEPFVIKEGESGKHVEKNEFPVL